MNTQSETWVLTSARVICAWSLPRPQKQHLLSKFITNYRHRRIKLRKKILWASNQQQQDRDWYRTNRNGILEVIGSRIQVHNVNSPANAWAMLVDIFAVSWLPQTITSKYQQEEHIKVESAKNTLFTSMQNCKNTTERARILKTAKAHLPAAGRPDNKLRIPHLDGLRYAALVALWHYVYYPQCTPHPITITNALWKKGNMVTMTTIR